MKNASPRSAKFPLKNRRLAAWLLIGLVLVLAVGAVILSANPPAAQKAASSTPAALNPASRRIGPASAAVIVVEYGDFGCITCQAWHDAGILKQVLAKYGDKIRFEWRDFPVITLLSPDAAEAADCAADQGQFWSYHDLLYAKAPALEIPELKAYAVQLGLDAATFNQCLDSGQHTPDVNVDRQAAFDLGFQGTPSFLVNDRRLVGPPTLAQLSQVIDAALAGKK